MVEQVSHFNYLRNDISYEKDKDVDNKLFILSIRE